MSLFILGSVFEEYVFLVLGAGGSGPVIPSDGVMKPDYIDDELVRKSVLKDIKCGFFIKGVPCFVCEALELSNVVVEVFLLHAKLSELFLGSGFNGSVSVCIDESMEDGIPQIFFGGKYSSYHLIHQPFCLF